MVTVKFGNWSLGFGSDVKDERKKPLALIILDGWGHSSQKRGNAIALAKTPNYDEICKKFPQTLLAASGARVGLMPDSPGNSEVGYLNLGTGRIAKTNRKRISEAIESEVFFENEVLKKALAKARKNNSAVHLVGLVSDGEVHSSMNNLFALLRMARDEGCAEKVFVHGVLDGKDVPSRTGEIYVEALEVKMADIGCGKIATLCGRNFAMDKTQNWERTARFYTMLVHSDGERAFDAVTAVRGAYLRGIKDEFIPPIILEEKPGIPIAKIDDDDIVIFFNHRSDGMQQIVKSLANSDSNETKAFSKPDVEVVCLTEYNHEFDLPIAFKNEKETNVLSEIFAANGVLNYRLTETEKYDYITYFFNGGIETEHPCERRDFIKSAKNSNNGHRPENGCFKVTDKFLYALEAGENDVFIVNLASADIIAHTGSLQKTIEAVQNVDACLGEIIGKIQEVDGIALITSDHGHCEEMSDEPDSNIKDQHTLNPVPFHFVSNYTNGLQLRENGALEDVAPTILGILGIEKPKEMTGNNLLIG